MDRHHIEQHRREILQICRRHGVESVRVFGSVARGDSRPGSDLDLLVTVGPEPGPWFPGGLVNVVTEAALDDQLRPRVLSEAVPL